MVHGYLVTYFLPFFQSVIEMGPNPTRPELTLDLQKIRGQPGFNRGTFRPDPKQFFYPKQKKIENLTFLGEIFQILTQTRNGWPNLTRATKNWPDPGENFLTQTHH